VGRLKYQAARLNFWKTAKVKKIGSFALPEAFRSLKNVVIVAMSLQKEDPRGGEKIGESGEVVGVSRKWGTWRR